MQQKAFVGCCCPSFLLLFLSNAADTRWIMLGNASSLTSWCVFPQESALTVSRSVFICLHRPLCILVDLSTARPNSFSFRFSLRFFLPFWVLPSSLIFSSLFHLVFSFTIYWSSSQGIRICCFGSLLICC